MATLISDSRKLLEKVVVKARDLAEVALCSALENLGVGAAKVPAHLDEAGRTLRTRLRTHGRQLGDVRRVEGIQAIDHLVQEGAYEHWHRMLFARFLAENDLLIHPDHGVGVTLAECEELAKDQGCDTWDLAGRYASRMLPQIFRPQDPVLELQLAPEHQQALEKLLADLPADIFRADDSLGWVYQFWQAKRKEGVNASEVKIGAEELPAVTQLFTENYMVEFLLHNSLGAWWITRHPGEPCPVPLTYLRTLEDGTPAAGHFKGWPDHLKEFKLLDPCCGSGHFLVAAFRLLVALRMADERLSASEAVDSVLAENLHGLELDARCVEIAVFALALAAWTTLDGTLRPLGVRPNMPSPLIACCGLKVSAKAADWTNLVPETHPNASRLKAGLKALHSAFDEAPLLGSLLEPGRQAGDLFTADYDQLEGLLVQALKAETPEASEEALTARGLVEVARLLGARYHLVITNVPYLARGRQEETLKAFCETHYSDAKNDLANVFLERCLELCRPQGQGVVQIVMPQNWLFLNGYKNQRMNLLKRVTWNLLARLGPGAFETITGEVVKAILLTQTRENREEEFRMRGLDVSNLRTPGEKAGQLRSGDLVEVIQKNQLNNPDAIITLEAMSKAPLLSQVAGSFQGLSTGDNPRFVLMHWEVTNFSHGFAYLQTPAEVHSMFIGMQSVLNRESLGPNSPATIRGREAWSRKGIGISRVGSLSASLYLGHFFTNTMPAIVPIEEDMVPALWCFLTSDAFVQAARSMNQSLSIDNGYLSKIPFDPAIWREDAATRFPKGLPKPCSDDPTQWLFHGHPQPSTNPLQVAIGRLAGHRWPAETDKAMELSDEARSWVARCSGLDAFVDDDGIVPIPAMRGEQPAEGRLRQMLAAAIGSDWAPAKEQELLHAVGYGGKSLDAWLRDGFFDQHCKLFHQRPFIWQVWDGLRDGFSVLVNYHKLDRKGLESLAYSYLGDWITRQKEGAARNESGAQGKLEKALELQRKLVAILEGEAPYDIFVRWKPLEQQPLGWEPDFNDGVRLNIRPFIIAEVLRKDPKIDWRKDRGKDGESAPWFKVFQGERINDHHLSLEEKLKARATPT